MAPTVIVLNHWGGVPTALHGNVLNSLQHTKLSGQTSSNVGLTRVDAALGLRALLIPHDTTLEPTAPVPLGMDTLPKEMCKRGFRTVMLGPCGIEGSRHPTRAAQSLYDPRKSLKAAWGIERCSSIDTAYANGCAAAHDEDTLREALDILRTIPSNESLFLWVNLLSCRDVLHRRFRKVSGTSTTDRDEYIFKPSAPPSPFLNPINLGIRIGGAEGMEELVEAAARADAATHGETLTWVQNEATMQYQDLVQEAWGTLQRLDPLVENFWRGVSARDPVANRIVMASNAFALLEHRVRNGAPTASCCKTFFASTVDEPCHEWNASLPDVLWYAVLNKGLHTIPPSVQLPTLGVLTHMLTNPVIFARIEAKLEDRMLACVYAYPWSPETSPVDVTSLYLAGVFDLDNDASETYNVKDEMAHLHEAIWNLMYPVIQSSFTNSTLPMVKRLSLRPALLKRMVRINHASPERVAIIDSEPSERLGTVPQPMEKEATRVPPLAAKQMTPKPLAPWSTTQPPLHSHSYPHLPHPPRAPLVQDLVDDSIRAPAILSGDTESTVSTNSEYLSLPSRTSASARKKESQINNRRNR